MDVAADHKSQIYSLYGLRFFVCLIVLITHICVWAIPLRGLTPYFNKILHMPGIGMSGFFILSGFLIHYIYNGLSITSWNDIKRYYIARIARIYPLYLILVLVYYKTIGVTFHVDNKIEFFTIFFLGIQSWFYKVVDGQMYTISCFSSAWSISTELFFYLAYPFFSKYISQLNLKKSILYLIMTICIGYIYMFGCYQIVPDHQSSLEVNHANSFSQWWFYISPYTRIFDFIIGCFLAQLYFKTPKILSNKTKAIAAFCCVLSVVIITFLLDVYTSATGFVYILAMTYGYTPFLAVILFYCAKILTIKNNSISKILFLLGNCSFSLYLLQELLLRRLGFYKPNTDELFSVKFILIFLGYILTMTFISIFVFKYIETYTKVLMKRILNNPKKLFRNRIPEFM